MWLSKKHNLVEMSTFVSDFTALKLAVELAIALRYKLCMFGVPLEGPTEIFYEKKVSFQKHIHPRVRVAQETSQHHIS